jgi:hypothetical protein
LKATKPVTAEETSLSAKFESLVAQTEEKIKIQAGKYENQIALIN